MYYSGARMVTITIYFIHPSGGGGGGGVRAFLRECVSVSACVRWYVRVNQCVAPPCIDRKRGPNSRMLLNLIPGRPFTMFSISLYDDIRRKEASQKEEFANSLYLSNTF